MCLNTHYKHWCILPLITIHYHKLEDISRPPELRQLTVMFCDLVGSTKLAEQLDLEDLRDITSQYHTVCTGVIEQHDGSY